MLINAELPYKSGRARFFRIGLTIGRKTEGTLGRLVKRSSKPRSEKCWRRGLVYFNKLAGSPYCISRAKLGVQSQESGVQSLKTFNYRTENNFQRKIPSRNCFRFGTLDSGLQTLDLHYLRHYFPQRSTLLCRASACSLLASI